MRKKCIGKNEKNVRENKNVRIGDVLSSGTAGTLNNCPECSDKYTVGVLDRQPTKGSTRGR
jgi:hypothetical protein